MRSQVRIDRSDDAWSVTAFDAPHRQNRHGKVVAKRPELGS